MVFDKIEVADQYSHIDKRIKKAFEFIANNDLYNIEEGKYLIDGNDLFAIVSTYKTKEKKLGELESHDFYADLQYIIEGEELMGVSLDDKHEISSDYDQENDITFHKGNSDFVTFRKGYFAIFLPKELHMPGITLSSDSPVKKIVFKIRYSVDTI